MEQEQLTADTLFLACTRPAMWHGVPLEAMAINFMGSAIFMVIMGNPLYLAVAAAIHYGIRSLVGYDYNMFTTLRLWSETKGRARNKERWGGASVSPLPLHRLTKSQEVRVYV